MVKEKSGGILKSLKNIMTTIVIVLFLILNLPSPAGTRLKFSILAMFLNTLSHTLSYTLSQILLENKSDEQINLQANLSELIDLYFTQNHQKIVGVLMIPGGIEAN